MISILYPFGIFVALVISAGDAREFKIRADDPAFIFPALAVLFMMASNVIKYRFASRYIYAAFSAVLAASFAACFFVVASNTLASAAVLIAVLAAIFTVIKAFDVSNQTGYRDGFISFYALIASGWLLHIFI